MTLPVIAIDGPSASGKGTVAERVAAALGFHYLDSGALYRLVTLQALRGGVSLDDPAALARAAREMEISFRDGKLWLGGEDVTEAVRTEAVSSATSRVAASPQVRAALLERQHRFRQAPGPRGRRARHGLRGVPRRDAEGVPDGRRRHPGASAAISS